MTSQPDQNTFNNWSSVSNQTGSQVVHGDLILHESRNLLPNVEDATFHSYPDQHRSECLNGTRVELLNQIMMWSSDPQAENIFWLKGMAGTGKSTIARTVARRSHDQKRLGASFFFSRGAGDRSHAVKFFTTLAHQLAYAVPGLKKHIDKAIAEHGGIAGKAFRDQWAYLICQPLKELDSSQGSSQTLLVVIDALDECESDNDARAILELFAQEKDLSNNRLLIFVTSRPEASIRVDFRHTSKNVRPEFLHHIPQDIVNHDIQVYLESEVTRIQKDHELPEDWPAESDTINLAHHASGLFIYAATLCRFIGNRDDPDGPEELLKLFLHGKTVGQAPIDELDKMYTQVLTHSIAKQGNDDSKNRLYNNFRDIVGCIVILLDILSINALANLLALPERKISATLGLLHSLLDIPKDHDSPIRMLHPSFREFLLDVQRCSESSFRIDSMKAHDNLATGCLVLMSRCLKRNICNLTTLGTAVSENENSCWRDELPAHLRYACLYWVSHFEQVCHVQQKRDLIRNFLLKHFLHWLEALSLMGKIPEGVLMIERLGSIVQSLTNAEMHAFLNDARRFILEFRSIIETAPLQVYNSALLFSPEASIIKRRFSKELPGWIERPPIVEKDWTPSLQALEGHSGWVRAVVFSPDGQLLASASGDNTVRLWDPATGASRGTLEGHSGWVSAVVFSPDGQLLASAGDNTVRLWDPATGASRGTLEGHSGWVSAVVFSPDGQLLASASGDNTVRLWDVKAKVSTQQVEHQYNGNLSFSTDGSQLDMDGRLLMVPSSSLNPPPSMKGSADPSSFMNVKGEWVRYKDYNILWLPPNRRPGVYAFRDKTLVLGNGSGRVTFFQFSSTATPAILET